MENIIHEKISADHLLYVSLKYTKTCDVIMNLLLRWRKMIDTAIKALLLREQEKKVIDSVSENAIGRIKQIKEIFKDDKNILETVNFFMMLRKLEELKTERIGEFRKNVALKIYFKGGEVLVNLEKLKIYAEMLEKFINTTKSILLQE